MILSNLVMQNYKKYKDKKLEFTQGLTGIIGKNGAGKSTVFDAITFALYGDVRGEKETIRHANSTEKEVVSVTLFFEIDGKNYKVQRELRGKTLTAKAYLYDGDDTLIAESAKGVTLEVVKLIGMNKEAFMHTVFASQKELTALSGLKNEDRKKIIRKLLGLQKIDNIEKEIRAKLTALNRDIKSFLEILLSAEVKSKLQEEKEEKSKILINITEDIKKTEKEFEEKSKQTDLLTKELKSLQLQKDDFLTLQTKLEVLKKDLENTEKNQAEKKKKLQILKEKQKIFEKQKPLLHEYKELEKTVVEFQNQKEKFLKKEGLEKEQTALRSQYKSIEAEIKEFQKKLEEKPKLLFSEQKEQKLLEEILKEIQELEQKETSLKEEIAKYKGLIENTSKQVAQIENIGKGSNCPTCTRPLLDEYDQVINSLKSTIDKLNKEEINSRLEKLQKLEPLKKTLYAKKEDIEKSLKDTGKKLSILNEDEKTLKTKESEFQKITQNGLKNKADLELLKDVKYEEKLHLQTVSKIQSLRQKYEELLKLQSLLSQIPHLEEEIKELGSKYQTLKDMSLLTQKTIKEHEYDEKIHQKTVEDHERLLTQKTKIQALLSDKKVQAQKLKGEIDTINSKLERDAEQTKQLQKRQNDKNDYEKLKLFMAEFKNRINSQITPRISHLASQMYSSITKGKYQHIEVDQEFNFYIYDEGVKYPIERFSGGEIDLANLVLRIAVSKTLSELSGSGGVGFLAFDEVFGSQDEERRYQIMEAFHTIKEQYRQIFLISHESEIKEMFERVVEL